MIYVIDDRKKRQESHIQGDNLSSSIKRIEDIIIFQNMNMNNTIYMY